ncbi:MAG: DUF4381 domain-containing protein [Gammaproteobacteria bacterium]|nr:DUF4381 domain-containing protein [Gammaproteobacteria bacterium]
MSNTSANSQELLKQLKDIHSPDPVSWWPLAPGWWIIIILLIISIGLLVYFLSRKKPETAINYAIAELNQLKQTAFSQSALHQALRLFRRCSLIYLPKSIAASESIPQLLKRIPRCAAVGNKPEMVRLLGDARYAPSLDCSPQQWQEVIELLEIAITELPLLNHSYRGKQHV